jgi:tetratricopeptide (TPR) repeat protein
VGGTAGTTGAARAPSPDASEASLTVASTEPDASGPAADVAAAKAAEASGTDAAEADVSSPDAGEPVKVAADATTLADAPADEPVDAGPEAEEAGPEEEDIAAVAPPEAGGRTPVVVSPEQARASAHWASVGFDQLGARQFSQARSSFERSLLFDPRNRKARLGLGRAAFQQGKFAEAVRYLEPIYRTQGNMLLGIAYVRVGRTDDARTQFERILDHDPTNADAQRALRSLPP